MVMIPAIFEHVFSLINNMPANELPANGINATWREYLELYTYKSHAFILSSCKYFLQIIYLINYIVFLLIF